MYLATNEGVLRVDLTNYENNLLLLLDWDLYDSSCHASSFIDNWFEYNYDNFHLLIQYIFGLLQISFNVGQELMNGFYMKII